LSLAIHFGFGKHGYDIGLANLSPMLFVSSFAGTFMIIGAAWSKTSFALTLVRISSTWQKGLLWFIIVSINVVFGASALFTWIRCWPLQKVWDVSVEGTCWHYSYIIHYNVFTAGKWLINNF
jgi:hypothetical protein